MAADEASATAVESLRRAASTSSHQASELSGLLASESYVSALLRPARDVGLRTEGPLSSKHRDLARERPHPRPVDIAPPGPHTIATPRRGGGGADLNPPGQHTTATPRRGGGGAASDAAPGTPAGCGSPGHSESLAEDCSAASPVLWVAVIATAGLLLVAAHYFERVDFAAWAAWAKQHEREGMALFVLAYVASLVLMLPASILALLAGGIFGLLRGSALVYAANVVGQTLAFLAARHALRAPASRLIAARWPAFPRVDAAVQREGWRLVFVLRLSPCLPYNLLNYALGLTGISLMEYSWSSAISIIPYVVSFVYLGCLSSDVVGLIHGGWKADRQVLPWALAAALLIVAAIAYGVWFTRRALSAALEEALTPHSAASGLSCVAGGFGGATPLTPWRAASLGAAPLARSPLGIWPGRQPVRGADRGAERERVPLFELASLVQDDGASQEAEGVVGAQGAWPEGHVSAAPPRSRALQQHPSHTVVMQPRTSVLE